MLRYCFTIKCLCYNNDYHFRNPMSGNMSWQILFCQEAVINNNGVVYKTRQTGKHALSSCKHNHHYLDYLLIMKTSNLSNQISNNEYNNEGLQQWMRTKPRGLIWDTTKYLGTAGKINTT